MISFDICKEFPFLQQKMTLQPCTLSKHEIGIFLYPNFSVKPCNSLLGIAELGWKLKRSTKIILSMLLFYYFSFQLLLSNIFDCRWWKLPMCSLERLSLVKGQSTFCQKFCKGKWWIQPSTNNNTAKRLWGWAWESFCELLWPWSNTKWNGSFHWRYCSSLFKFLFLSESMN